MSESRDAEPLEVLDKPCRVCGKGNDRPMAMRGEEWCCEAHRKVVLGETMPTPMEWAEMEQTLYATLWKRWSMDEVE